MNNGEILSFIDLISIASFIVGLENLSLNKTQVNGIMQELQDNQNKMLFEIIEQNKQIISMLKEKGYD